MNMRICLRKVLLSIRFPAKEASSYPLPLDAHTHHASQVRAVDRMVRPDVKEDAEHYVSQQGFHRVLRPEAARRPLTSDIGSKVTNS